MIHPKRYILLFAAILVALPAFSQKDNRRTVRKGNSFYLDSLFNDAETSYRKAVKENGKDAVARFNLGNALLRQRNPKDAAAQYEAAIKSTKNPLYLAKSYHNMGVILQSQKQYAEAISSYENALRNNPHDNESRYNLALCKRLAKNQKQNQNQNNQDKNKQEKDKDKQQQKQQKNNDKQQQKQRQDENRMSKDNAQRLLDAAKQEEQKTQDKLRRSQRYSSPRSNEQNW